MKKSLSLILIAALALNLSASSAPASVKASTKEGVAPYELSEDQKYLLESFGMTNTSQLLSFNAPKEAITLRTNVYRLGKDSTWETIHTGGLSIGTDRKPTDHLEGTIAIQLKDNYAIDFNINCAGSSSFSTDPIDFKEESLTSTRGILQEFQSIELNTEIPVTVLVYDSGTKMQVYTPQDYFEPSKFEGMDLVQVVTLEFTDKEL